MAKEKMKKSGFTMIELIVVMAILAILATISFLSFSSYIVQSRDSKRIVDLESISSSLEVYYKKHSGAYPKPSDSVIMSLTGSDNSIIPFSYLGFVKDDLNLDFNNVPQDPLTGDFYAFGLTADKKFYEVSATLESSDNANKTSFINSAYADSNDDYAYLQGNYKQDINKGYYLKHLIMLQKISGIKKIPRSNVNVGSMSGSILTTGSGFSFVENGSTEVPYPIKSKNAFTSVGTQPGSDDFILDITQSGITVVCPTCTN